LPSVPLTYVIGTVGMLFILGVVTLISVEFGLSLSGQATETSLNDAAQYVASEIDTIAVTISPSTPQTIAYHISMPKSFGYNGYAITLVSQNGIWQVVAYSIQDPSISASVPLFFNGQNTSAGISVYVPQSSSSCPGPNCGIQISSYLKVYPSAQIYSGDNYAVVWANTTSQGGIYVGIGDLKP
jgi:hypothetical protein